MSMPLIAMDSEPFTDDTTHVSEPHKVGLKMGLNFSISITVLSFGFSYPLLGEKE